MLQAACINLCIVKKFQNADLQILYIKSIPSQSQGKLKKCTLSPLFSFTFLEQLLFFAKTLFKTASLQKMICDQFH